MAKTNSHDGDMRGLHQHLQVVHGRLTMGRVTRAVRDEDAVVIGSNLLDLEIVWEDSNTCPAADKASENVLLHATIDQGNVVLRVDRFHVERSFGADSFDQVDLAGIYKALILIRIVLISSRDSGKRGTLLSEVRDDSTSINSRDGRDAFSCTPLSQAFYSGPMAVLLGGVGHDDTSTLNVWRLKVSQQIPLVTHSRRHTIVPDEGLGEYQNLAAVRRIGHRLWVANERRGKDGLARDVGVGTEGSAMENRAILEQVSEKSTTMSMGVTHSNGKSSLVARSLWRRRGKLGGHLAALASLELHSQRCSRRDKSGLRLEGGTSKSYRPRGLGGDAGEHVVRNHGGLERERARLFNGPLKRIETATSGLGHHVSALSGESGPRVGR